MKHLLNTLFVTTETAKLTVDGENVVVEIDHKEAARFPLHTLSGIVCFSYYGATPALMGACSEKGIDLAFCTPRGKFLARTCGITNGNVLLRREQYRIADTPERYLPVSINMIAGKIHNCRRNIERTARDHPQRIDQDKFHDTADMLKKINIEVMSAKSPDELRGLEGAAATRYYSVFDDMILRNKEEFFFRDRNRRPPIDNINALLSFVYSILARDCASALESVGLDPYVGFMHRDRPGRISLALDLMEELRPSIADRFVLKLVNNQMLKADDFIKAEDGAVRMSDEARRTMLKAWQERKQEYITHPYLEEKIQWGLVPYAQALLLSRFIRGDIEAYPPFLWK